jgi:hypothetical protein
MTNRRPLLGGLVGLLTLAALLVAPATTLAAEATAGTTATTTTTATTCTDGRWPAAVQGVPTLFHAGASAGDYIWHDAYGWHLRVTHRGTTRAVFSGRIVSSAPMTARAVRLEGSDFIALSADRLTLTYRFANYGAIDGLNFRTDCARRLTFTGYLNGAKLPISRIWVGRANHHPLQNPFVITRVS